MALSFVLAPDAFKESMTALEACQAMQRGILAAYPAAQCIFVPMADGGEGTVDTMLSACSGQKIHVQVQGPLATQQIDSYFAVLDDGTAVIEMAKASGLELLPPHERNPLLTSTYGTGQLIQAALARGVKKILIGLGGSATNDAGSGMAQALGVRFLDAQQQALQMNGSQLQHVQQIDTEQLDPRLSEVEIIIASDVSHVLCGEQGASYVFGPQKGATAAMVAALDAGLAHFAGCVEQHLQGSWQHCAGAGAAGGLGFGLLAFAQATLCSGAQLMIEHTALAAKIRTADYVFTGEGKIDGQTEMGKVPWAVAQLARQYQVPVVAFAGKVSAEAPQRLAAHFQQIIAITPEHVSLAQALKDAEEYLARACYDYVLQLKLQ
jgi:glycerate 2-kinase